MKNSWLVLPVILIVIITPGSISAGQEVLDSLISIALKNNPELKAAEYMYQSTQYNSRASGSLPDPIVSIGAMNLPANSMAFNETPMSGINLGISQKIPWMGKLGHQKSMAGVKSMAAKAEVDIYRNQLMRRVTDTYLEFSYWSLSLPIIDEYHKLLEAAHGIAEVRYANGEILAQDMLKAGSMMSRAEVRLLNARQKKYSSLINLRRITGDFELTDQLNPFLSKPDSPNREKHTIENNPMLGKLALNVEKSKVNRKLSRSEYWPDLMLGVDYRIRDKVVGDPVNGADYLSFKVGITLPLWFFKKQNNNTKAAEQLIRASQKQKQAVRDLLFARLSEVQSRLNFELESLREYDLTIIPEARAAAKAAEVAYEVGQVDFNALLAAQTDLFEIKLERLGLLKQYHQSLAILVELTGSSNER